jgi:hypothetical protein
MSTLRLICAAGLALACTVFGGCGETTETIAVKVEPPTTTQKDTITEKAYTYNSAEPAQITTCYHMAAEEGEVLATVKFPEELSGSTEWRAKVRFSETQNEGQFDQEVPAEADGGESTVSGGESPTTHCQITSVEKNVRGKWERVAGEGPAVPVQRGPAP